MTALGLVEDVKRTLYRDDAFNESKYPLDDKIGLLEIDGIRSRYTQVFAWNTARLYAELTEADAALIINDMLSIKIDKTQVGKIGQAVAENYINPVDVGVSIPEGQTDTERIEEVTEGMEGHRPCENVAVEGFLAEKLRELEARSDRDVIIQAAVDGIIDGVDNAEATQNVLYLSSDGTGVPGLRRELSDNGKDGGRAGTFEAKIGCAFRQGFTSNGTPILDGGKIVRIPETTKYMGTTDKIDGFRPRFTEFAYQNGLLNAGQIVFLSDGASWLKNTQVSLCPNAIAIVDFFHAIEHLDDVIKELRFHNSKKRLKFAATCRKLLELGDIEQLITHIRSKANQSNSKNVEKKLAYFEGNAERMRYGLFRAVGLFIGSGVIEAACKTIVGKRLKNAGMHWSKKNANGVIALRCAICSNEFNTSEPIPLAA